MNPELFLADLEAKPAALEALAAFLDEGDPFEGLPTPRRVVFLGMGSSRYAAGVAALRLRAAGIDAVAEYASSGLGYPPGPGTLAVAISATGGSRETLDAVARHKGRSFVLALTNAPGSPVTEGADLVVPMVAGEERGGVSCRTFQHTLALLLTLTDHLASGRATRNNPSQAPTLVRRARDTAPNPALAGTAAPASAPPAENAPAAPSLVRGAGDATPVSALVRRAAEATADLLDRRGVWLDRALSLLDGPHGVYAVAPAERLSSAEQSALMFREGPRRPADACETGDWAHVDVYLTKTLDYRAIMFPGSRYDEQAMDWIRQRDSAVLTVGGSLPGERASIRYLGDADPDVALLSETLVAELVAAAWWAA